MNCVVSAKQRIMLNHAVRITRINNILFHFCEWKTLKMSISSTHFVAKVSRGLAETILATRIKQQTLRNIIAQTTERNIVREDWHSFIHRFLFFTSARIFLRLWKIIYKNLYYNYNYLQKIIYRNRFYPTELSSF